MNILVCVKQVPGTNQVEVDPETGVLKRDNVESKLNPYDLFALEMAFQLAAETDGAVKTLSMGPPQARAALEETLWMGASEGVLLSDRKFGGADVVATAAALELGARQMMPFDVIFCGKQTTDGDTAQVGPELAERLGIEHAANVAEIVKVEDGALTVVVDLDDAKQTLRINTPCLLTVEKDANVPRLPSYKRKKAMTEDQIRVLSCADLPDADESKLGLKGSLTRVEKIFPPEKNELNERISGTPQDAASRLYALLRGRKLV